jgi:N utilization substance protein A
VEFNQGLDTLEKTLRGIDGADSTMIDKIVAMGMVSVLDVEEVGPEPLVNELQMERGLAQKIVVRCAEEARRVAEQQAAAKQAAAGEPGPTPASTTESTESSESTESTESSESSGEASAASGDAPPAEPSPGLSDQHQPAPSSETADGIAESPDPTVPGVRQSDVGPGPAESNPAREEQAG